MLRDLPIGPPLRVVLGILLGFCLLPAPADAKNPQSCGAGITLNLSASVSGQGSLLLLEVRSHVPISDLSGEWNGRAVPFWEVSGGQAAPRVRNVHLWNALLGVDLEKPPGTYSAIVQVQTDGGKPATCSIPIFVRKGKFATESLHVEKEFVEPDPEQIKRANEERDRLRAIFDQVNPMKLWTGDFRVPLDGVTTGGNFGKRRILNGQPGSPHSGVDFSALTGTPVYAAQSGRVVLAQELFFSGNTVVVDHGLGIYTFYGHLSEIDVKLGDNVESGQLLGKVGATGRVTGPHLHWGLTVERARVNPLQLVKLLERQ